MTIDESMDVSVLGAESTAEMAEALRASGAVDGLLAQIDSGQVTLTGEGGLLPGLIKLALECGLAAELTGVSFHLCKSGVVHHRSAVGAGRRSML